MKSFRSCFGYFAGIALAVAGSASASPESPDFYQDVYPFLKANCIACHNKTTTKAGLNMETPALMIKGGDTGPSIVPGKSAESLLVDIIGGLADRVAAMGWTAEAAALYRLVVDHSNASQEAAIRATQSLTSLPAADSGPDAIKTLDEALAVGLKVNAAK